MITPTVLSVGGFLMLGLAAAPHCAATCGLVLSGAQGRNRHCPAHCRQAMASALTARFVVLVLAGMTGSWMGAASIRWLPTAMLALAIALVFALALRWVIVGRGQAADAPTSRAWSFAGLGATLALVPCPVFYMVLGYIVLAGDVVQGGLLAGAFAAGSALGAVLVMAIGGAVVPRLPAQWRPRLHGAMAGVGVLLMAGLAISSEWGQWICRL